MTHKTVITIPTPCHENWDAMTPAEKGKFCGSCQKHVYDFTKSSDREILQKFGLEENICGLFLDSQLNREMIIPKEKNRLWITAASGLLAFLSAGTQKLQSQERQQTVQTQNMVKGKRAIIVKPEQILIRGNVYDSFGAALDEVQIQVEHTERCVYTNSLGQFSITMPAESRLVFSKKDYISQTETFSENRGHFNVFLEQPEKPKFTMLQSTLGGATITAVPIEQRKRTFVGRIFSSISKIFN